VKSGHGRNTWVRRAPDHARVASARRTRQATAILALVGLVSWAAVVLVQLPKVDCQDDRLLIVPGSVLDIDVGARLLRDQRCELKLGGFRVPLPS